MTDTKHTKFRFLSNDDPHERCVMDVLASVRIALRETPLTQWPPLLAELHDIIDRAVDEVQPGVLADALDRAARHRPEKAHRRGR